MPRPASVMDLRYEWPQRRLPIFFIVDDPAPCLNLAYYEQYFEPHVRDIPNSFTASWADLIEEYGVRGKFSVLPVPAGIGRIDRPLPDVKPADQEEFLRIVRERVSPQMDICIEFLTHFLAWDIQRERPVDYTEKLMAPHTNADHLTDYFIYGLRILHDLGLNPTGATSPGASCREIEWAYQSAIRNAVREVTGSSIAWYFLHVDSLSPVVLPRVAWLDRAQGRACVSMVSAADDPSWDTQWGEPSSLDSLITADGQSGRLVDLYRNGSVIGFHTHWQSLFSEGRATGLADLRVTLGRIREHFGERVRWTKCSELARIVAAQSAAQATVVDRGDELEVRLTSTVECPDFTMHLSVEREIQAIYAEGRELQRLPDGAPVLRSHSWSHDTKGASWCCDHPAGELRITLKATSG